MLLTAAGLVTTLPRSPKMSVGSGMPGTRRVMTGGRLPNRPVTPPKRPDTTGSRSAGIPVGRMLRRLVTSPTSSGRLVGSWPLGKPAKRLDTPPSSCDTAGSSGSPVGSTPVKPPKSVVRPPSSSDTTGSSGRFVGSAPSAPGSPFKMLVTSPSSPPTTELSGRFVGSSPGSTPSRLDTSPSTPPTTEFSGRFVAIGPVSPPNRPVTSPSTLDRTGSSARLVGSAPGKTPSRSVTLLSTSPTSDTIGSPEVGRTPRRVMTPGTKPRSPPRTELRGMLSGMVAICRICEMSVFSGRLGPLVVTLGCSDKLLRRLERGTFVVDSGAEMLGEGTGLEVNNGDERLGSVMLGDSEGSEVLVSSLTIEDSSDDTTGSGRLLVKPPMFESRDDSCDPPIRLVFGGGGRLIPIDADTEPEPPLPRRLVIGSGGRLSPTDAVTKAEPPTPRRLVLGGMIKRELNTELIETVLGIGRLTERELNTVLGTGRLAEGEIDTGAGRLMERMAEADAEAASATELLKSML